MIETHCYPDNASAANYPPPWDHRQQDSRRVTSALIAALFFPHHAAQHQPAMCRPPTASTVSAALLPFLPTGDGTIPTTVTTVRGSPSLRLPRTYTIELSSNQTLQLVLSPPSVLRLLRFERSLIESEAIAIRWIHAQQQQHQQQPPAPPLPLPTLIHASYDLPNDFDSPYTFLRPSPGTPLALLPAPLPPTTRRAVDKQVGSLLRRLATLRSPTGGFGPLAAVIPTPITDTTHENHARKQLGVGGAIGNGGAKTWGLAFEALLEGILRDGEDMAVGIPYGAARKQLRRLGWVLERVKVARLVIVEGGKEENVKVDVGGEAGGEGEGSGKGEREGVVTGLHDWSTCVFGDPLFAAVFSEGVSEGFMEGFNGRGSAEGDIIEVGMSTSTSAGGGFRLCVSDAAVDDVQGAPVRLLLYQMYHALVDIVREFHRPRVDSSKREMEGRKRLSEVLGKLVAVPDMDGEAKRIHRRSSGEMSPAKRLKGDEGGDGGGGAVKG